MIFKMSLGKILIIAGIIILVLGLVITSLQDKLKWFGHLPFDLKINNESFYFYAPFGSMILVSIIITILINIFFKLFK
jgi:hypothetical protein